MKVLVDTSAWVDHFRRTDPLIVHMAAKGVICTHPAVIGELALGNLRNREHTLSALARLPKLKPSPSEQCLALIQRHSLWGRGIGWTDLELVTAAFTANANLYTKDKRLLQIVRLLHGTTLT